MRMRMMLAGLAIIGCLAVSGCTAPVQVQVDVPVEKMSIREAREVWGAVVCDFLFSNSVESTREGFRQAADTLSNSLEELDRPDWPDAMVADKDAYAALAAIAEDAYRVASETSSDEEAVAALESRSDAYDSYRESGEAGFVAATEYVGLPDDHRDSCGE